MGDPADDPDAVEIKLKLYPVHVYRATPQPLTEYRVHIGDGRAVVFKTPPSSTRYSCESCRQRRQARNLVVRVYYDAHQITCAPGKGCKR